MTHSKHPLPARQIITSVKTAVKLQSQPRVSAGLVWTVHNRKLKVDLARWHKFPESITDITETSRGVVLLAPFFLARLHWLQHYRKQEDISTNVWTSQIGSSRQAQSSFHVLATCGWFMCGLPGYGDLAGPTDQRADLVLFPFRHNLILHPMWATNPFMCTAVRLRWGHHVRCFV